MCRQKTLKIWTDLNNMKILVKIRIPNHLTVNFNVNLLELNTQNFEIPTMVKSLQENPPFNRQDNSGIDTLRQNGSRNFNLNPGFVISNRSLEKKEESLLNAFKVSLDSHFEYQSNHNLEDVQINRAKQEEKTDDAGSNAAATGIKAKSDPSARGVSQGSLENGYSNDQGRN